MREKTFMFNRIGNESVGLVNESDKETGLNDIQHI